ncbi:MAG: hypothetical protein JNN15_12260 [Blastocatellia bacterium]|nr:hypothetical protein [Blastocatellia bacterium]
MEKETFTQQPEDARREARMKAFNEMTKELQNNLRTSSEMKKVVEEQRESAKVAKAV